MTYPDTPEHWVTLSADFIHAMTTMGQRPEPKVAPTAKPTKKPRGKK